MRRVDLNLLYILRELLKEPNTTKVGERLGLTQSAVSASLGRLRWAFKDDLFVRSGRTLVPTRRAESLLDPVEHVIQCIEALVEEVRFEPENLQRNFTVASADFLIEQFAHGVIAELSAEAPNTRAIFSHFLPDTHERMRSGHLDLMISSLPVSVNTLDTESLRTQVIYQDRLVIAVRASSERYGDSVTIDELNSASFVDFNPAIGTAYGSTTQRVAAEGGFKGKIVGEFTSLVTLLRSLRSADVLALVPRHLIHLMGENDVRVIEMPFERAPFDVAMIWNRSFDHDPEHQWFREIVEREVTKIL
ncbi:MAG: LysR substrate-binding domain-containing protein [Pseudomonadota bacterium]